jgi:hypothetical protein
MRRGRSGAASVTATILVLPDEVERLDYLIHRLVFAALTL